MSLCALGGTAVLGLDIGATAASAAEVCPNEQLRHESNINPVTKEAYSVGLPDCRAYEMVSPAYKQSFPTKSVSIGIPAAPDGEAAGFQDEGDFGEPQNYTAGAFSPALKYVARRGPSEWTTSSTFAPAKYVILPTILAGLNGDYSPDLHSSHSSCGVQGIGNVRPLSFKGYACAAQQEGGPWGSSGLFPTLGLVETTDSSGSYLGASSDMSRLFIQSVSAPLLENDSVQPLGFGAHGIYEVTGIHNESGSLRLVDVDNEGRALGILFNNREENRGPLIGDEREVEPHVMGTAYHAISASGETVFFTATPDTPVGNAETPPEGSEALTVYARRPCTSGPACAEERETPEQELKEHEKEQVKRRICTSGSPCIDGRETVAVSNPELNVTDLRLNREESGEHSGARWKCNPKCEPETEAERKAKEAKGENSATYQGASADGSKVFFTTRQQLRDKDATPNLYEYDLEPCKTTGKPCVAGEPGELTLISRAPEPKPEANVRGVLRTSSDGSVVYFVAGGVLSSGAENKATKEKPETGKNNLYAYDTNTGQTKFVAQITPNETKALGGVTESFDSVLRHAQTTPDGRYLVFDSAGKLLGRENGASQVVYRYDFETEQLTWVSKAAPGCSGAGGCAPEGKSASAWVAALPGTQIGAEADSEDWNRAISGCPEGTSPTERAACPPGTHDGEDIIFTTPERLQNGDENNTTDVYEWHCPSACPNPAGEGEVHLISDGSNGEGAEGGEGSAAGRTGAAPTAAMSATGRDIFVFSDSQLVGQDKDRLFDVYDARVDGGFPRPEEPVACAGEACQAEAPAQESFGLATSSVSNPGGNLGVPGGGTLAFQTTTKKPLTRVQKLDKALAACRVKHNKKKRTACEKLAEQHYGAKSKAKGGSHRAKGKKAGRAKAR